jgi:hypothetical protein
MQLEQAGRQVKSYQGGQGRADQAHIQVVWLGRSGGTAEQAGRSQHAGRHFREAWKTELSGRRPGQTGSRGEAGRQGREDRHVFRQENVARQHRACRAVQGRAGSLAKQSR